MADSNLILSKRNRRQEKQIKGLPPRVQRRRNGSKVDKYTRYRNRVGRPNGPGAPGNKSGRNRVR
jgi:hypothetical protein